MGFEGIATTIGELDKDNPTYTDPRSRGDDHLRSIKSGVKGQFPGLDQESPGIPVLTNGAEMNSLVGYDTAVNIQDRFAATTCCLGLLQSRIEELEWWVLRIGRNFCELHPTHADCITTPTYDPTGDTKPTCEETCS